MKIIFMGTPAFALPSLQALLASEHEVVAVYSQPPRPAGRGQKLTASPVHQLAQVHNIPVFTPTSLKPAEVQTQFAAHRPDAAIVAAYGLLLPQAILDIPRLGCINIHPSDLPRWRGAAPIQRTIMVGDTRTACCIMHMEAGLDSGPVLARTPFAIPEGMNAGALHDAMAEMGAKLLLEVLASPLNPQPQPLEGITYAHKITKADQWIDWAQPATHIRQHILGLSPSPAAITSYGNETWKILDAELASGSSTAEAGVLLDNALTVATGHGALRILKLQRPGKAPMLAADFLRGTKLSAGERFISTAQPQPA